MQTSRLELSVGALGLLAALAVLPLPTVKETPEVAAVLAVAAVALLAGERWALPILVLADVALIGLLWPRAFLHDPPSQEARIGVFLGLAGALPGIVAFGRAAPALAELVLGQPTQRAHSYARVVLIATSALWIASPLVA
jgi:hypothetical protein